MAFLTWKSGDIFILKLTLLGIGATVGFLLVNYPTGRLFMGDGGAYFIGFWVAEIAVLTIVRNPGINAWQVLAIYAYPVTEVLFSMYRKKVIRKMSPGVPDRVHLHMLIYRRVVCQIVPRTSKPWIRNAAVACITAVWVGLTTAIAVGFGNTIVGGVALVIFEVFLYMAIYTRLVRGRWCLDPAVVFGLRAQSAGAKL
jgi:UDP-N-acetylmuramyl pentapeptide phosphotransferase/UDP-N-acetylglucosamine-1-phosphate transferase